MRHFKILVILAGIQFILCAAKAQSTFSVEYGRKYSQFENTGIYLYDARYFKDQNTFTNFYSINYQGKMFSDFFFEVGIISEYRRYDLALRVPGNQLPITYINIYKSGIDSWSIPIRINYNLRFWKKFSLNPSIGFLISFNDYSYNLDEEPPHAEPYFSLGNEIIVVEYGKMERTQEKVVIIPNLSARLDYNIYNQFNLFAKVDFHIGIAIIHQVDYKINIIEEDVSDEYEGSLINKGASINVSFGLSYTLKKKSE